MVKIYQHQRDTIANKMVTYTFSAREKVLWEIEFALAREVYNIRYDEQTRVKMNALPDGWLSTTNNFTVNAGGYVVSLSFGSYEDRVSFRVPYKDSHIRQDLTNQDLINRVQALAISQKRLREEQNEFRSKLWSFLKSITTDTRLFDLMPELKEVIGDNFFGNPQPVSTAIVTTAAEILCVVAKNRGEDREGCCEGKLVKEVV